MEDYDRLMTALNIAGKSYTVTNVGMRASPASP